MKSILFTVFFILISAQLVYCFERPKDFRDIKWGNHISELKDMVLVSKNAGREFYQRTTDDLKISGQKVKDILYVVKGGVIIGVDIRIDDRVSFGLIRSKIMDLYGSPDVVEDGILVTETWKASSPDEADIKMMGGYFNNEYIGRMTMMNDQDKKKDSGL